MCGAQGSRLQGNGDSVEKYGDHDHHVKELALGGKVTCGKALHISLHTVLTIVHHLKAHGRNSYRHHPVDKCVELCAPSLGLLASSQVY